MQDLLYDVWDQLNGTSSPVLRHRTSCISSTILSHQHSTNGRSTVLFACNRVDSSALDVRRLHATSSHHAGTRSKHVNAHPPQLFGAPLYHARCCRRVYILFFGSLCVGGGAYLANANNSSRPVTAGCFIFADSVCKSRGFCDHCSVYTSPDSPTLLVRAFQSSKETPPNYATHNNRTTYGAPPHTTSPPPPQPRRCWGKQPFGRYLQPPSR